MQTRTSCVTNKRSHTPSQTRILRLIAHRRIPSHTLTASHWSAMRIYPPILHLIGPRTASHYTRRRQPGRLNIPTLTASHWSAVRIHPPILHLIGPRTASHYACRRQPGWLNIPTHCVSLVRRENIPTHPASDWQAPTRAASWRCSLRRA